jgi:hypothetical protein
MLIPNMKFLVLPLVALAVIASLPSTGTGQPQGQSFHAAAPAKTIAQCEPARRVVPHCTLAAKLSNNTVLR